MKHLKPLAVCLFLALALLTFTSCAAYRPLQIESVSQKETVIVPKFTDSYYYFDRDHTLYLVMRSKTQDKATSKMVDQIATFRIFWRPIGGRTTMENTALNATYRYVLMTADSVGMYEGAGFVRLWGADGVHHLKARLMDGDLRLTESSSKFVDTLGRSRVRGNFSALYNDAKAFDMLLAAHQEFFNRSLTVGLTPTPPPATSPGTQPATTRPTTLPRGDGMQP
ncbi:MAG TPA: hypothetical protein VM008_17035 [Phycisphaerae bacterium]|nr:hypothetical protein [Phycisphaerae bacterium]